MVRTQVWQKAKSYLPLFPFLLFTFVQWTESDIWTADAQSGWIMQFPAEEMYVVWFRMHSVYNVYVPNIVSTVHA